MKTNISIVIPIYNASSTLERCIASLSNQTMKEWEAICVNDGSTDSSLAILDKLAILDNRIRVYSKTNSGVSDSRNLGISLVKSKYVMMLDADDTLHKQALEIMYNNIRSNEYCDMVVCSYNRIAASGQLLYYSQCPREGITELTTSGVLNIIGAPWAKLYKKDIIDSIGLRFNSNLSVSEDDLFVKSYLTRCQCVCFLKEALYNYEFSETSVIHRFETGTARYEQYAGVLQIPVLLAEFLKQYPAINSVKCEWERIILETLFGDILWLEWSIPKTRITEKTKLRKLGFSIFNSISKNLPYRLRICVAIKYAKFYICGKLKRIIHRKNTSLKAKAL